MKAYHRAVERHNLSKQVEESESVAELPDHPIEIEGAPGLLEELRRAAEYRTDESLPEMVRIRRAYAVYERLAELNPLVTIYHDVNEDSKEYNFQQGGSDPNCRVITASEAENNFNGQGIYFGLNDPYNWAGSGLEGECYVIENVPLADIFPSLAWKDSRAPMACLPVSRLTCHVQEDPFVDSSAYLHSQYKERGLVASSGGEKNIDQPARRKYLSVVDSDISNPENASWYMCFGEYYGVQYGTPFLGQAEIDFLDEKLGLIGIEIIGEGTDFAYQRFYVRETKPILCLAIGSLLDPIEIVFGGPDTPGGEMIEKFIQDKKSSAAA